MANVLGPDFWATLNERMSGKKRAARWVDTIASDLLVDAETGEIICEVLLSARGTGLLNGTRYISVKDARVAAEKAHAVEIVK